MAKPPPREHYIPVRRADLVDLLCAEPTLPATDAADFRRLARLLAGLLHLEHHRRLEELKDAYAPFDPDADTLPLVDLLPDEKQRRLNLLFSDFGWLMERANYKHLSRDDIEPSLRGASAWGMYMDVDFSAFERLAMFARGDTIKRRPLRDLRTLYRSTERDVEVYQRLVLILKLRPHRRLGPDVDTASVHLKVFKDIPKLDVKMLLPGARVRFTGLDKGRVGLPILSGLGTALLNAFDDVVAFMTRVVANPTVALYGAATGAVGYGAKSYFNYLGLKQRYHLSLTQSLYFQSLGNNAGVLTRLMDEAEEQEGREALLGFYLLWRQAPAEGWAAPQLASAVDDYLVRSLGQEVAFQITDALEKLRRLGLVEQSGPNYRARPLSQALEALEVRWRDGARSKEPGSFSRGGSR